MLWSWKHRGPHHPVSLSLCSTGDSLASLPAFMLSSHPLHASLDQLAVEGGAWLTKFSICLPIHYLLNVQSIPADCCRKHPSLTSDGLVLKCTVRSCLHAVDNSMPWTSPKEGPAGVQVSHLCCPLLFTRPFLPSVSMAKANELAELYFLLDEDRRAWSQELLLSWEMKGVASLAISCGSAFHNWTLIGVQIQWTT